MTFSNEKVIDNEITFLSSTIFLVNDSVEFRPSRKNCADTVLTNFKMDTIAEKYLMSNIFTMLHNARNSKYELLWNDMDHKMCDSQL